MLRAGEVKGRQETSSSAQGVRGRYVLLVGECGALEESLKGSVGGVSAGGSGGVRVESCGDWFEAVSRLARRSYDAVVLPAELAERRAEAAVRTVREAAGEARIVVVSGPGHEGLARRMVGMGCDEYLVWPVSAGELVGALKLETAEPVRAERTAEQAAERAAEAAPKVAKAVEEERAAETSRSAGGGNAAGAGLAGGHFGNGAVAMSTPFTLAGLAVAEVVLDALVREPGDAAKAAIRELNARLPGGARLELQRVVDRDPTVPPGMTLLSRVIRPAVVSETVPGALEAGDRDAWVLHLFLSVALDEQSGADLLGQVAQQIGRVLELQDRHCRLQKLAITDDLTGLYNARYFRHFLERILARAKEGRFPVTLLMFDIDSFKKYNDSYGHPVGDEILKQTARMIQRSVRDHDLVARLGGDEFAVVFWEKDGPRQVIGNGAGGTGKVSSGKPPQSPIAVFERFKRMIAGHDFEALGPTGRGQLTISGGLAVYPYDARTPEELIEAADKALMFGAKRSGKNTIHLVGQEEGK